MTERERFVERLLKKDLSMTDLCLEFGISRKTGYKIWNRFRAHGDAAFLDESRAPARIPHRTPRSIEELIVETRSSHPSWGPKKIRAFLLRRRPHLHFPSSVTMGAILRRRGLVKPGRPIRRHREPRVELRTANASNDVWCADFKGQFRLGNGSYCYPLTISDRYSRFLLQCEGLESTTLGPTKSAFEVAFREHGLPVAIRTDNGTPFAASRSLGHLSRLSVWLLRLGISLERIEPAHPEQNGQHERMHRVLKQETTRPAARTLLQQQERFDRFVDVYNFERPHEAIDMRLPADLYTPSPRRFPAELPPLEYPMHDDVRTVHNTGEIRIDTQSIFISGAFAGERVGIRELEDGRWLVSFAHIDLGIVELGGTPEFEPLPISLQI